MTIGKNSSSAKIESGEIIVEPQYRFPKSISPTSTMLPINKSLYEQEADVNNFEHRVISEIAGLPNVRWWHRVIDSNKASFVLNGFINHYPDFIVATTSGKIVLVETRAMTVTTATAVSNCSSVVNGQIWLA